jgi:hypothetical protein
MASEHRRGSGSPRQGSIIPWPAICAGLAFVVCMVTGFIITTTLAERAVKGWPASDVPEALARDNERFGWMCSGIILSWSVSSAAALLVIWTMRKRD